MLITRPNHDITTQYLFAWSNDVIIAAKNHGVKVVDLAAKRATRREFTSVITKIRPSLIIVNGHGNTRMITGYNNEPLVVEGENELLFRGAIVYARSCQSAVRLGRACVHSGTVAYIGYTDDFVFFIDETKITRPREDKTAKRFLEPSNDIVMSLLKGHTVSQAQTKSKNMSMRTIQTLMTSETPKEEKELIPYLRWNLVHQVFLGDESARVV
ncbi:hypothetical protein HY947_03325 [Candidatus Gottesmanbacteria bacterium]|nr:hypothetical protein [Candidatus Gottesmanbacteria bacterium]